MNPPEQNDPLDAWLRGKEQYIDDNGFTQRVLAGLPRRRRNWRRMALLLGATFAGAALAAGFLPWNSLTFPDLTTLSSIDLKVLLPWVAVMMVMAALVWTTLSALEAEE